MRHIRLSSYADASAASAADEVAALLLAGEIGVVPTETVPGLICAWDGPDSIDRLCAAKGRDPNQKCQFLLADVEQSRDLGVTPDAALTALGAAFWPGPLTLIVPSGNDTVGLHIPDLEWLRSLIDRVGRPLVATSANPPRVDPAVSAAAGYADLPGPLAFIVSGPGGAGTASTVCRLSPFEIIRPGPVTADAIADVLAQTEPMPS